MKRAGNTYHILLAALLWLSVFSVEAQTKAARIWTTVQFNKEKVMVGEPLLVTITVYTSTWFTSPPQFGEIQVPEAMMVDYQQRTGSVRKTIGNKTYPAIEKKYVVYPFRHGENSLPSLSIVVESPPEGDFKGRRSTISSPERTFTVMSQAEGIHLENLLTAYQVSLSEAWDRPLDQLMQGDVPEREIRILANGAVAALIPPLDLTGGSFGSVYSKPARLDNAQNQASFTGTRTEKWSYLMESPGVHTIPGIVLKWYNPRSGKVEQARIEEREIIVDENPNMEFLLSMQDSLQAMLKTGEVLEERESLEWFGLNWWQLIVVLLTLTGVIGLLARMFKRYKSKVKKNRIVARESEAWYFERLIKAGSDEPGTFIRVLLNWYDRFRGDRYGAALESFICASGDPELRLGLSQLEGIVYGEADVKGWNALDFLEHLKAARKKAIGVPVQAWPEKLEAINPADEEVLPCINR